LNVEPFEIRGLRGHRGGTGASALLLHGGAAVPDYMSECAQRLDGLFATIRYTQRGTPPSGGGPPYTIEANASLAEHFQRGTLANRLPHAQLPALFVHGEGDPMPLRAATETAALITGARVEVIADSGHFPWLEQPEAFRAAVERLVRER
jgi:pimeloyl-ACP methyl ester carboxylesterase